MALTKKQENEIYWKMYEEMTGNSSCIYKAEHRLSSGWATLQRGFCYAHNRVRPNSNWKTRINWFDSLTRLQLFNPNIDTAYWFHESESENYQFRLFALAMAIAMTEE